MSDLYAFAHELLNASQAAYESRSYVAAIVILQDLIKVTVDLVNGIAAAASSMMM